MSDDKKPKKDDVMADLPPQEAKEDKTITVKKDDLMKMVEEIAEAKVMKLREENETLKHSLEKEIGLGDWQDLGAVKDRKHTAKFKLWRDNTDEPFKMIIDWKYLRMDYDEATRAYDKPIYKITLQDDEAKTSFTELTLKQFSEILDSETVDIVKMDKIQQGVKLGKVRKAAQKEGYTLSPGVNLSGLELHNQSQPFVDDIVTRDKIICTVRRQNGLQFEINADRLNA